MRAEAGTPSTSFDHDDRDVDAGGNLNEGIGGPVRRTVIDHNHLESATRRLLNGEYLDRRGYLIATVRVGMTTDRAGSERAPRVEKVWLTRGATVATVRCAVPIPSCQLMMHQVWQKGCRRHSAVTARMMRTVARRSEPVAL